MRRYMIPIAVAAVAVTIFSSGYVAGLIHGPTSSSAATAKSGGPAHGFMGLWGHGMRFGAAQPRDFHAVGPGGGLGWMASGGMVRGQVTAVNGDTITIRAPVSRFWGAPAKPITTIDLNAWTQYLKAPGQTVTKSAVTVVPRLPPWARSPLPARC